MLEQFFSKLQNNEHGEFNEEEIIHLIPLENPSPVENISIQTKGYNYIVTSEQFDNAIKTLRKVGIFPSLTCLPQMGYQDPGLKFRTLYIPHEDFDLITKLKERHVEYVPNDNHPYDSATCYLKLFGIPIQVPEEVHDRFIKNRKIAVQINSNNEVVWLTSYEYNAYQKYECEVYNYKNAVNTVHEILLRANEIAYKNSQVNLKSKLLTKLPFDAIGAYKINLSGLSASSNGCGSKRNTVIHLVGVNGPMESYSSLDTLLAENAPLCGKQKGRHMGLQHHSIDRHAESLDELGVTCKACLAKIKQILKTNH
ncbi:TPA: hypothetical protein ACGIK9_003333 [Acinetobacter baumannii]|uniref:hypothetical protein n=1 Tax=Acinetobacter baumannii TaxID=470 RepID=UPI00339074F6